jgi:two-component system, NarL family, nitrate/nitrite response regulator NarL
VGGDVTTVIVADDHPLYRRALVEAIQGGGNVELVGEAADGNEALAIIRSDRPQVAIVDVRMPGLDGMGVLNAVVRDGLPTRVLLLSAQVEDALAYEAVEAGAAGILVKDAGADEISDAVESAARGETVLAADVQAGIAREIRLRRQDDRPALSPREREILGMTAQGLSAPDIAQRLTLSPTTVRTHLQNLYEKLGVSDRAAAVAEAMRRGLLE